MEDFHSFLRSRRSIRHFTQKPVPIETINRIIETATFAPSAHDSQPWRFVVVIGDETKKHLAEAISSKYQLDMRREGVSENKINTRVKRSIQRCLEAPLVIVLCCDMWIVKKQPDHERQQIEDLLNVQSASLAGLQLLLAAHAEGLGGTWICWPLFAPDETKNALTLEDGWEPQGMFFLGYPDETSELPARKPLQEVARFL